MRSRFNPKKVLLSQSIKKHLDSLKVKTKLKVEKGPKTNILWIWLAAYAPASPASLWPMRQQSQQMQSGLWDLYGRSKVGKDEDVFHVKGDFSICC